MSIVVTRDPEQEEELCEGIAVCGASLSSPVVAAYIDEEIDSLAFQ
jgi:hypothetical protein